VIDPRVSCVLFAVLLPGCMGELGYGPPDGPPAEPATLSEAGLWASGVDGPLAVGVRPYDVRYPLWTDGAEKRRFAYVPPGATIDTRAPDGWRFPVGTRLYKQFLRGGVPVEVRVATKTGPASWSVTAYVYRADGSDADPAPEGATDVLGTPHDVPSGEDCAFCHDGGEDFALAISSVQLDRATFDAWIDDGVLPAATEWLEPPGDAVEREALGWLHGNCGHCHGPRHWLAEERAMRLSLDASVTDAASAPAVTTTSGVFAVHRFEGMEQLVVPGDANASQLFVRAGLRDDPGVMPPLGTEVVDGAAQASLRAWIESLE